MASAAEAASLAMLEEGATLLYYCRAGRTLGTYSINMDQLTLVVKCDLQISLDQQLDLSLIWHVPNYVKFLRSLELLTPLLS